MMSVFTRKYPFHASKNWVKEVAIDSFVVFLILYLLQPFGFSLYSGNKLLVAFLFGLATFLCCMVYGYGSRLVKKRVAVWRIWHQVLDTFLMTLLISFCNCGIFMIFFHFHLTLMGFLVVFYWSVIIGCIITTLNIGISYNRYLHQQMESLLSNTREEQSGITITLHDTNLRGDDLQLAINDLLYVEAQKNNVHVYFIADGKVVMKELHASLSAVLDDLKGYDNFFQCHRSFAVNLNNIVSARGNSNGYQLTLGNDGHTVPVSRSYVPKLKSFIA